MGGDDILKKVFSTSEEDVETFMDVVKTDTDLSSEYSGKANQITAPKLRDSLTKLIRIQHGWDGDDYVWHIAPAHHKRPFKVSIDRVVYTIARVMNETVPETVEVRIWLPSPDWDIPEITFKAFDLAMEWSISEKSLEKILDGLMDVLNELV